MRWEFFSHQNELYYLFKIISERSVVFECVRYRRSCVPFLESRMTRTCGVSSCSSNPFSGYVLSIRDQQDICTRAKNSDLKRTTRFSGALLPLNNFLMKNKATLSEDAAALLPHVVYIYLFLLNNASPFIEQSLLQLSVAYYVLSM